MQTISVIVPTLNRAELLDRTIDHIQSQTISRERYEVIVVDNNSIDNTQVLLAAKARQYPNLKFTCEQNPGAAAARNLGLRRADGDLVLFIDDDIVADVDLIERHLHYHSEHSDASVVGAIHTQWETVRNPFLRYLCDRQIYNSDHMTGRKMDFSFYHTGNVSTSRDMLKSVGGFDERFAFYGMEDIELGYRLERLGSTMVPAADAIGTHHYFPTFSEFAERCEQAGFSLGLMVGLHPELRNRFTENSRISRFLRPLHGSYRFASPLLKPFIKMLAVLEPRRGSELVSAILAFHYTWALRYHFFVGYSRYLECGQSGFSELPGDVVDECQAEESPLKIESGSGVSQSKPARGKAPRNWPKRDRRVIML